MPNFIDRRLNPKDKSLGNRQRFLKRAREELKRVIKEQVKSDRIIDVDAAHGVPMPRVNATSSMLVRLASKSPVMAIMSGNCALPASTMACT